MDSEAKVKAVAADRINEYFARRIEVLTHEKKTYLDKLERAIGNDVFKYLLLINISALDTYVVQTRLQAQQSFRLSKAIAITGFIILGIAVVLSICLTMIGSDNLNAAYLGSIAGVITEFTAGVFFYLYSKTLQQINLFHDKLVSMQQISMSHMAVNLVKNKEMKDKGILDLARALAGVAEPAAGHQGQAVKKGTRR